MHATWSRSLLLLASLGPLAACDELLSPPQEEAPVVAAPLKKAPAPAAAPAPAPAPVKKKAPVINFDEGGSGGGGWG